MARMTATRRALRVPEGVEGDAADLWREITRTHEPTAPELSVLREAVRTLTECQRMEERLRSEGYTVTSPSGVVKPHPLASIARTHRLAASRLLRELGLLGEETAPKRRPGRPGRSV